MVYLFFIPMFWYFLIMFRKDRKPWVWGSLLVASGLVGGFTNAYFAAFYAIFLLSVLVADIFNNLGQLKPYIKQGIILFVLAVAPLLIVNGLIGITDWAETRPSNTLGFFLNKANKFSIFLPNATEFRTLIQNWIDIGYEWEGRAYVGLPPTLLAISMVYAFFHNLATKKKNISLYIDKELNIYLLGAFLVLLFSMCFPFIIMEKPFKIELKFLLNFVPWVKQFSALGRFAWVFYYMFTIYTAIFFYNLYVKMKAKGFVKFPVLFLSFVIMFWGVDALFNVSNSFNKVLLPNNILESNNESYLEIIQKSDISTDNYQAIFFMPFANSTGDKLDFARGFEHAFVKAMSWSYHTGLPLLQSYEARIPFNSALSSVQMLSDIAIRKTRLDDMNEKPLLLLYTDETLNTSENWLKSQSKLLWSNGSVSLAKVELDVFHRSHQYWRENADKLKGTLVGNDSIKANVPLSKIYHLGFDAFEHNNKFAGNSALFSKKKDLLVFNEVFSDIGIIGNYELSFWLFFDTKMHGMPTPVINVFGEDGLLINTIELNQFSSHNVFKNWVRVNKSFKIEKGYTYKLEISGTFITIDEVLLQPSKSNVWIMKKYGMELMNNFVME
jgi:hypothetical protein